MDKNKQVSISVVVLVCICALVWTIGCFIYLPYADNNTASFVLKIIAAIAWDFCTIVWIVRYIKSKKKSAK